MCIQRKCHWKQYGAKAIQERCSQNPGYSEKIDVKEKAKEEVLPASQSGVSISRTNQNSLSGNTLLNETMSNLLQPEHQFENVPYQLRKKKRKKGSKI